MNVFVLFIQLRLRTMLAWKLDTVRNSTIAVVRMAKAVMSIVVDWVSIASSSATETFRSQSAHIAGMKLSRFCM
jgi:hypothetical protein